MLQFKQILRKKVKLSVVILLMCSSLCVYIYICVCAYVGIFLRRGSIVLVIPSGTMAVEERRVRNHGVKGKCSCSYLYIDLLQVWSL